MNIQQIISNLIELEGKTLPSLKGATVIRGRKINISVKSNSISAIKGNSKVGVSFNVIIKIYEFLSDQKEHRINEIKAKGIIQDECSIVFVFQILVYFGIACVRYARGYVIRLKG
ncbi:MAG: hypothetical protein NC131_17470 [Roseburia sp.]|nr:hypothetical protein [Roseburia sp.]